MNIISIFERFPDQKSCIKYLESLRWKDQPICAYCKSDNNYPLDHAKRFRHHCNNCKKTFSVTINTIMHDTRLPLQKWFLAVMLIGNAKKGLSSRQLSRDLNLPVKTAYSLCQRIRKAMLGTTSPLLKGIIELDETYIGGKPRYRGVSKRGRGTKKTMVIGAVERGGKVIAHQCDSFKQSDARNLVLENVDIEHSVIHTDEYGVYNKLGKLAPHSKVNHGSREYVRNNVHTNSIESFWALVKRAYHGQHHHYSKKHTNLYIAESVFKYNNRKNNPTDMFNNILEGLVNA